MLEIIKSIFSKIFLSKHPDFENSSRYQPIILLLIRYVTSVRVIRVKVGRIVTYNKYIPGNAEYIIKQRCA